MFTGKYKEIRSKLDYTFHEKYSLERQLFQDQLIDSHINLFLEGSNDDNQPMYPKLIYLAGAMGAGKSHTIRKMYGNKLSEHLLIDPDKFRDMLPEYQAMKLVDPVGAPTKYHKESCTLSEIILNVGLQRGYNIISDGSMLNYEWYTLEIVRIRREYPKYDISLIYVQAEWEDIKERVEKRCEVTGRCIDQNKLRDVWSRIPQSISRLKLLVDHYYHLYN